MKTFQIILPGQPATKKNGAMMVARHAVLLPSKPYQRYEKHIREFLDGQELERFDFPVNMQVHYYLQNYAHWPDLVGLMQATADVISDDRKHGREYILVDDRIIYGWNGTHIMGIDKDNPRAELTISEIDIDPSDILDPWIRKRLGVK